MITKELQRGFVALTMILIILAVSLVVASSVALLSIGEAQSGLALAKGEETLHFVEGCMEDALLKARGNAAYTGGAITRPEGTCTITVGKVGNVWTLTATTTDTKYARTIEAIINRSATGITLTSWKEI